MPFSPWVERPVQGTLAGEQPARKPFKWTMPWQEEHWTEPQPEWTRTVGKVGLGAGLLAGGALLGGYGIPAAASWLSGLAPGLTGAALPFVAHPGWMGMLGGGAGLLGSSAMAPGELGQPTKAAAPAPTTPAKAPTTPTTPPTLPTPGAYPTGTEAPTGQPQIVEVGGQQFWWNPTGGIYGTGGWDLIPARTQGLTPEQQMEQARLDREAALARTQTGVLTPEQQLAETEAQRAARIQELQLQYQLEQQGMERQLELQRQMQQAQASQSMAQMYASDPYKYWAQMGQGTPGAVARLTGGKVAPGGQMGQVPLSTPSAQWWGNLLPSEQQQISGGLNWLGVNPEDWYSMYQKMIPGLGQRQVESQWAR